MLAAKEMQANHFCLQENGLKSGAALLTRAGTVSLVGSSTAACRCRRETGGSGRGADGRVQVEEGVAGLEGSGRLHLSG